MELKSKNIRLPHIFYLGIFLIPFLYNPWGGANPYEITKHGFLLTFIGLCGLVGIFLVLKKREFTFPYNKIAYLVIGLWGVSYLLSQLFSITPMESFWGTYERFQGTFSHIYFLVHFLLCLWIFRNQKLQTVFFHFILWSGVLLSIYGILQFFGADPLRSSMKTIFGERIFATLGGPNFFGQFLIFPITIGGFFITEKIREKKWLGCSILSCTFLLMLGALMLTLNRASLLGLFISGIFVFILWLMKKNYRRALWLSIGSIAVVCILASGFLKLSSFDFRSLSSRFILWSTAVSAIQDHVLIGSGLETISERIVPLLPKDIYEFEPLTHIPDRSHNEFLDIFLARGLLGAVLYIINIAFLIWIFIRRKLKTTEAKIAFFGIVAYTISVQFGFSMTTHIIVLLAFWAVLLISTLNWQQRTLRIAIPTKMILAVVLLLFSYFSFAQSYSRIATDSLFTKAIHAYFQDEQKGLEVFDKAISYSPYYIYPLSSVFTFYQDIAFSNPQIVLRLETYANRAFSIAPRNFQARFMLGEVEFWKGNYEKAEKIFAEVMHDVPTWPNGWYVWGSLEFKKQRHEKAIAAFEKLKTLAPPYQEWNSERQRLFRISNFFYFDGMEMLRKITDIREHAR